MGAKERLLAIPFILLGYFSKAVMEASVTQSNVGERNTFEQLNPSSNHGIAPTVSKPIFRTGRIN